MDAAPVAFHETQDIALPQQIIHFRSSSFHQDLRRFGEQVTFASRSEAACAVMLERFCSKFRAISGITCQVEIGESGKQIDFKVGDTFVEYHPIMLDRSFINTDALHSLRVALRRVPKDTKIEVYKAVEAELAYQYFKQRRNLLDGSPYRSCELIVCTDHEQFIDKVVRRFADRPLLPYKQMEEMFIKVKKAFEID